MADGQLWRQYVMAGIASFGITSIGYSMGWTSPVNMILKDEASTPLDDVINLNQEAWIGSLINLGAIIGPFIGGLAASKLGRKWALLLGTVPLLIGWILIAAASNVNHVYTGRVFWGVSLGIFFTISPMYCAEIATDDARGALGSFLQIFLTLGFLMVFSVGPYVSYVSIAYVGVAIVVLFDIIFYFMPETPIYHLTKNNREAAAECLCTIRGKTRAGVETELEKMAAEVAISMENSATFADVFKGSNFKAFYISCTLLVFQQFSGINAVLFYMTNIFKAAGASLEPAIATIIIGATQVVVAWITPFVVDRAGRRILMLASSFGAALGVGLLGMYFILDENNNPVTENMGFVPVLSLVVFIVSFSMGLGPLPWAIIGELMPIEVKAIAAPLATAFSLIVAFLVSRYFGPVAEAIGMYAAFWIFSASSVLCFFFSLFVLPETKGKSFLEIQALLSGESKSDKSYVLETKKGGISITVF